MQKLYLCRAICKPAPPGTDPDQVMEPVTTRFAWQIVVGQIAQFNAA